VVSSIVPNFIESRLDIRSHNRARLLNETAARTHIAYFIFLLALITSDDIDRGGSGFIWLVAGTSALVFILFLSIVISGGTIERINKYDDWQGGKHQCALINNVCPTPIGKWLYFKVCFLNTFLALFVGTICLWLSVSPSVIKHGHARPSENQLLQSQRKEYFGYLQTAYKQIALQTKDQFEASVMNVKDEQHKDKTLNVSYWINYENILYQLGSTEEHITHMTFPLDKTSIIGCGFSHQNHSVQWDDNIRKILVLSFNDEPTFEDVSCRYAKEEQRSIKSMVCTSFNANGPPDTTVGICIFTESDRRVSIGNYHRFLRAKVEDFHKLVFPALMDKAFVPQ